jgi:hypothetical protein
MVTFEIGPFYAHITEMQCEKCQNIYLPEEIHKIAPKGSKYGYDVIVFVGKALFLDCLCEKVIQNILRKSNISISIREIGYLGKKFIIYLALAHKESKENINKLMALNGGYILHLDATCEADSPQLMSALDSISNIVIENVRLASENSDQIIPFLKQIKKDYGSPIATVHDMGGGIIKAVKIVFPYVTDYICHYHFLRDIGRDLLTSEYTYLMKSLRKDSVRPKLRKRLKILTEDIENDTNLKKNFDLYIQQQKEGSINNNISTSVSVYFWIHWILNSQKELSGYGFPFDRYHYVFYRRLVTVKEAIETLPVKLQKDSNVIQLSNILVSIVSDQDLKKQVTILTEKIEIFDQLREAMQIALPNGKNGLNDDGKEEDVKTIKEKVTAFRNSAEVEEAAKKNIDYTKMLKQIDKYWDKLFADPITVFNSKGEKIIIQPQRTNNILERLFRSIKRGFRKKSGNKSLNRTFKSLIANTPLVENLKNSEYMKVLLDKHNSLEDLFADINVKDVRKELEKINNMDEKASMKINKILSDSNLPLKIAKATKKEAGY